MDDAVAKGAKVLAGGKLPTHLAGQFYPPTVLTNINKNMEIWSEEVFGPVRIFMCVGGWGIGGGATSMHIATFKSSWSIIYTTDKYVHICMCTHIHIHHHTQTQEHGNIHATHMHAWHRSCASSLGPLMMKWWPWPMTAPLG